MSGIFLTFVMVVSVKIILKKPLKQGMAEHARDPGLGKAGQEACGE